MDWSPMRSQQTVATHTCLVCTEFFSLGKNLIQALQPYQRPGMILDEFSYYYLGPAYSGPERNIQGWLKHNTYDTGKDDCACLNELSCNCSSFCSLYLPLPQHPQKRQEWGEGQSYHCFKGGELFESFYRLHECLKMTNKWEWA